MCAFWNKSDEYEAIVNRQVKKNEKFSDLYSSSAFVCFATEQPLMVYLAAAADFDVSSSGLMSASLYVPKVVACTGISRARLIALLSRLCSFFK